MSVPSVLVVRAAHQSDRLSGRLRIAGFDPVVVPVIAMEPPADGGAALRAALAAGVADSYDWIVFTSSNAVAALERIPSGPKIAVVGPGTAQAVSDRGCTVDLMPEVSTAEGLVAAFRSVSPGRALAPLAAGASDTLADGLRAMGWDLVAVHAYRTVPRIPPAEELATARSCAAVLFTSSSSVLAWRAVASVSDTPGVVVSIGPQTSATARRVGLVVTAEANPHTLDGLVAATSTVLMS
jgi:uroporphyrinogen-III synthase